MEVLLYAGLAFILCGISQVLRDLSGPVHNRPFWAMQPILTKAIQVSVLWFIRPIIDARTTRTLTARAIAFGTFGTLFQLAVATVIVWASVVLSGLVLEAIIARVLLSAIFLVIATVFVLPVLQIPLMLIMSSIAVPLDLLFPDYERRRKEERMKWPDPTTPVTKLCCEISRADADRNYEKNVSLTGLAGACAVVILSEALDVGREFNSSAKLRPVVSEIEPDIVLYELCAILQLFPTYCWFYDYSYECDLDSGLVGEMLTALEQIMDALFRQVAGFDAKINRASEYTGDKPDHAVLILAKALIASKGHSCPVNEAENLEIEESYVRTIAEAMKPALLIAGRRVCNAVRALANEHERRREEKKDEDPFKTDMGMISIEGLQPEKTAIAWLKHYKSRTEDSI